MCLYLSVYLYICLFIYLSTNPSIHLVRNGTVSSQQKLSVFGETWDLVTVKIRDLGLLRARQLVLTAAQTTDQANHFENKKTTVKFSSGVYIKFEIHIFAPPLLDLYFFPK